MWDLPTIDQVSWQVNDMKKNKMKLGGNCYSSCSNKLECAGFSSMQYLHCDIAEMVRKCKYRLDTTWCQGLTVICIWHDSGIMILEENTPLFFFQRCVLNLCRDKMTWRLRYPLKYFNPYRPKNRQRKDDKVLLKLDNDVQFVILSPLLLCLS